MMNRLYMPKRLMMTDCRFYLEQVYPHLNIPLAESYPQVSLEPSNVHHALADHPLLMLVAFTGAGKTTTLNLLRDMTKTAAAAMIPSRREIADWIAIPMAQAMSGETFRPVQDRVRRFHYTRLFAERVSGGMAKAFSWLYLADEVQAPILSEGVRGENEIRHALRCCPRWQIVELALHPITRLRRLSARNHSFDQASEAADLSFLPDKFQAEARTLLKSGQISPKALTIVQAESANYGLCPFTDGDPYRNYYRIQTDHCSPKQVAAAVCAIMKERADAKD